MGERVMMGRIGRPHGVRGLVHLVSFTDPPAAIFGYRALADDSGRAVRLARAGQGEALLARIEGVADRDAAARLTNALLYADRAAMPEPDEGEFYHADLLGLSVQDESGRPLGQVAAVHDHGAGVFLEVAGEGAAPLLLPFTQKVVPLVDLATRRIVVALPDEIVVPPSATEDAA